MRVLSGFEYRFWTDAENAALIEKYFPHNMDAYLSCPHGVVRADIARCLYLYNQGGIYADTDYFFLKSPAESFFAQECVVGIEEDAAANFGVVKYGNAFMAATPGFDLFPAFVESIFQRLKKGEERVVFIGGPHALSQFLQSNSNYLERIFVMPRAMAYPDFRLSRFFLERTDDTIGVHLCWGTWRQKSAVEKARNAARRFLWSMMA